VTHIGIDFDNTIARYDESFREIALREGFITGNWDDKGKTEIRDCLRRQPDGETTWMKLQSLVYGKFMQRAEMMPGVANFLLQCKVRHHSVYIVSHKTEYGHFASDNISLRQEALKWMETKRFFNPEYYCFKRENVFFASTREEKAERIAELGCDYFVDDLPEVFAEEKFPAGTRRILFGRLNVIESSYSVKPMSNWGDISNRILGPATDDDVCLWAGLVAGSQFEGVERVSGRGNSRIYKAMATDGKCCALKRYPDQLSDSKPRLETEFHALRFLALQNVANVPVAFDMDGDLNLGLIEWVEGVPVTRPSVADLRQAIGFVERLHSVSREAGANGIGRASEACLSATGLISQVEDRLRRLRAESGRFPGLARFLERTFEPLWEDLRERSLTLWPLESRECVLPKEKQTLSPSDFGFHNALTDGGKITFIDFEYFGWDDPVKLTADFLWHPAMELDPDISEQWKKAMLDLFSGDPDFASRLHAAMPLYGLRWAMIVLNEFLPGLSERRRDAYGTDCRDLDESRNIQLGKARRYYERVKQLCRR